MQHLTHNHCVLVSSIQTLEMRESAYKWIFTLIIYFIGSSLKAENTAHVQGSTDNSQVIKGSIENKAKASNIKVQNVNSEVKKDALKSCEPPFLEIQVIFLLKQ